MGYKKRGYIRDLPQELVKDYKLFAIACEGSKTEPSYFKFFQYLSPKIKVDVIEDFVTDEEMEVKHDTKSSPKWVLDRAVKYIEKNDLHENDDLWFVIDTDKWKYDQIKELADYCVDYNNWNIAISNPCFEVWLYFHKKAEFPDLDPITSRVCKNELSKLDNGGYHPLKFIPYFKDAIKNAKAADAANDHYMPEVKRTKVYKLGEAILTEVSKSDYENFINDILPKLLEEETQRIKRSARKK